MNPNPLDPSVALLAKLGSAIVHADEFMNTDNLIDQSAFYSCLNDSEVQEWLQGMKVFLPVKR